LKVMMTTERFISAECRHPQSELSQKTKIVSHWIRLMDACDRL